MSLRMTTSARLPRTVGRAYALDMILRGRNVDGPQAHRIGLVTEVLPLADLKARAARGLLAARLSRKPVLVDLLV